MVVFAKFKDEREVGVDKYTGNTVCMKEGSGVRGGGGGGVRQVEG